jgi:hypothetical protein
MSAGGGGSPASGIILIIVGIIGVLFLIGFFRSEPAFWDGLNYKKIMRLDCGITIKHPIFEKGDKAILPLAVDGYINGCGWERIGASAGTVQMFDGKGLPVTLPIPMTTPLDSTVMPFYFSTTLVANKAPTTDEGNILFTSHSGLLHSIPVTF